MEHFPISVTLLANAGVCIGYRGMTLLLDGIFGREGNPFSPLPADCRQKMCRGEPPFEKLDCLLFTHFHPDHFSPEMTMQIVGSRPVRALFFPEDEAEPVQELAYFLRRRDIPFVQLSHTTDHTVWRLGEHIRLQAFRTQHLGQEFYEVPHVCYRISFDGREVLFTADTDYLHETLAQISGTALEAAFVNPLFFQALFDKRLFHGALEAKYICVYHIPFREDDRMHMCESVRRRLTAPGAEHLRVLPLSEPYQRIKL